MIKEIHMKSCATYDCEGVILKNCPKVNFIYGPNGSGKSTISNYLQNPSDSFYAASNIVWTDELHADIMVYNRRFREQNFKSDADIAGVFTLGSATIEDIQRLDELKSMREKRNVALDGLLAKSIFPICKLSRTLCKRMHIGQSTTMIRMHTKVYAKP